MTKIPLKAQWYSGYKGRGTWMQSQFIWDSGLASAGNLLFKDKETKVR